MTKNALLFVLSSSLMASSALAGPMTSPNGPQTTIRTLSLAQPSAEGQLLLIGQPDQAVFRFCEKPSFRAAFGPTDYSRCEQDVLMRPANLSATQSERRDMAPRIEPAAPPMSSAFPTLSTAAIAIPSTGAVGEVTSSAPAATLTPAPYSGGSVKAFPPVFCHLDIHSEAYEEFGRSQSRQGGAC
jgi:hypothetical protein